MYLSFQEHARTVYSNGKNCIAYKYSTNKKKKDGNSFA